jgi:hypothetical protein
MDERTSIERLEDELVPEEEKPKPDISPAIAAKMQSDRARDLEAQKSGEISPLYDLESRGGK